MKVTFTSTQQVSLVNGVLARRWEGVTDRGIKCFAYIAIIGVHKDDDNSEFEREFQDAGEFSLEPMGPFDIRLVL